MYNKVQKILEENGEANLVIKSIYIAKFGGIAFNPDKIRDLIKSGFAKALVDILKKHPNVFSTEIFNIVPDEFYCSNDQDAFVLSQLFKVKLNIPSRLQVYNKLSRGSCIEEFSVLSNGSIYCAYAPIDDYRTAEIGHEYREILKCQIENELKIDWNSIGPSPIHTDFIIVNSASNDKANDLTRIYEHNGNIIIICESNTDKIDKTITELLFKNVQLFEDFYRLISEESIMHQNVDEINDYFEQLSTVFTKLSNTKWWKFWVVNKNINEGREKILNLYKQLIEFESSTFDYKEQYNRFINDILKSSILLYTKEYFENQLEKEINISDNLLGATEYLSSEIREFTNTRSVVFSTIIGALIGSLLTMIASSR